MEEVYGEQRTSLKLSTNPLVCLSNERSSALEVCLATILLKVVAQMVVC